MRKSTRKLRQTAGGIGMLLVAACGGADEPMPETEPGMADLPPAVQDAGAALSGDRIPTESGGDLVVHPVHHGSVVLSWNGVTIYVDPAGAPGGGGEGPAPAFAELPPADLVLVTDVHGDHLHLPTLSAVAGSGALIVVPAAVASQLPAELAGQTRSLANGETTSIGDIQIEAVPMYNLTEDRLQFHEEGRGNGYVLTLGGTRVYVAGDTEDIPEMRALTDIDVAFVPMNLPYTMSPEQAADAVLEFRPRIVYPYHFGESDVQQFAALVGDTAGIEVRVREWYP